MLRNVTNALFTHDIPWLLEEGVYRKIFQISGHLPPIYSKLQSTFFRAHPVYNDILLVLLDCLNHRRVRIFNSIGVTCPDGTSTTFDIPINTFPFGAVKTFTYTLNGQTIGTFSSTSPATQHSLTGFQAGTNVVTLTVTDGVNTATCTFEYVQSVTGNYLQSMFCFALLCFCFSFILINCLS